MSPAQAGAIEDYLAEPDWLDLWAILQVADDGFARSGFNRFTANLLQIFALPKVGAERDNLAAVFLHEPTENNRSV